MLQPLIVFGLDGQATIFAIEDTLAVKRVEGQKKGVQRLGELYFIHETVVAIQTGTVVGLEHLLDFGLQASEKEEEHDVVVVLGGVVSFKGLTERRKRYGADNVIRYIVMWSWPKECWECKGGAVEPCVMFLLCVWMAIVKK